MNVLCIFQKFNRKFNTQLKFKLHVFSPSSFHDICLDFSHGFLIPIPIFNRIINVQKNHK